MMGSHRRASRTRALALAALLVTLALGALAAAPGLGRIQLAPEPSSRLDAMARWARELAPRPSAEAAVRATLRRADEAGGFRVVTDAEQRLLPRGLARLTGARDQRVDLRLEGWVEGPDRAHMELAVEGGVAPGGRRAVVALNRAEGVTYVEAEGRLQAIEDPTGLAAPGGEPLAFLAAGRDFRYDEPAEGRSGGAASAEPVLRRVRFTLDGPAFAARVRDQQERALGADLPPGVRLEPPAALARARGTGRVWIDESGLPVRLELELALDEIDEEHDLRTTLVTRFSDFGAPMAIPAVVEGLDGQPRLAPLALSAVAGSAAHSADALARPAGAALSLALALALAIGLVGARHHGRAWRRRYAAVAAATILGLVGGPGLHALRVAGLGAALAEASERPSLADALGVERSPAEEELFAPRAPEQSSVAPEEIRRCGEGSAERDTDGEGLSDYVESCLGTNPIEVDSDRDLLNDRLEIEGIVDPDTGERWTSDPLRPDSNNDGLLDGDEWPEPHGRAPALDVDGDGLPNIWDPDNDGDGVRDGEDISPHSYTDYAASFELQTFRPTAGVTETDLTQVVYVHVQPEDEAHLRYSLTPLDWSYDDAGQIQVLGQASREIELAPMLAIDTTISPTLSSQFGVAVQENPEGADYPYQLLLPLSTVGEGGRIEALTGFLGYTPEELDELAWDARLVWTFTGSIDSAVDCSGGASGCTSFNTQESTIAIFGEESFRVTGLTVQLSGETRIAALSAPDEPTEDFPIMQALWGLNGSFLRSALPASDPQDPAYDTIEHALASITSNDPQRNFGITSTLVGVTPEPEVYANSIDAWQRYGAELESFLNARFERCLDQAASCVPDDPMVLFFAETSSGATSLDELAEAARQEGQAYAPRMDALPTIDVDGISVSRVRSTRWQAYEWRANEWAALELEEMSALQAERYPDMDPGGVALMRLSYAAWSNGLNSPVLVDDVPVSTSDGYDYNDLADEIRAESFKGRSIGRYFAKTYQEIAGPNPTGPAPTYASQLGKTLYFSFGAVQTLFNIASVTLLIIELADPNLDLDPYVQATSGAAATFSLLKRTAKYGAKVYDRFQAYKSVQEPAEDANIVELEEVRSDWAVGDEPGLAGSEASEEVSEAASVAEDVSSATDWIPLIGLIVGTIVAVTVYLLTISQDWDNSILEGYAAADLIASIILLVIFYLLALIPVVGAIILAVIAIIEALVYLITWLITGKGFDVLGYVVKVIADFFFQAAQVTNIGDVRFGTVRTALLDEPLGPVVGNTYRIWTDLEARVDKQRATVTTYIFGIPVKTHYTGSTDEVKRSHAYGTWNGLSRQGSPADARVSPSALPEGDLPSDWAGRACAYQDGSNRCANSIGQDFELLSAGSNVLLRLMTQVDFKLAFKEVIIAGSIPIQTIYQSGTSPEHDSSDYEDSWDQDAVDVYFDVLPPSLDELWTWSRYDERWANHDRDADGLRNEEELDAPAPGEGTDWLSWDTDGDGLSDGYEVHGRQAISDTVTGPDPSLASTDGDALDDGFELFVSQTSVNDADTDGDGLLDHEEVCVGGGFAWTVQILTRTARICANPNDPDPDRDGLTDLQEKAAGTSPFAWNQKAPTLRLEAEPRLYGPGGQAGTYLRPGAETAITLTLRNVVANQAEGQLKLCVGDGLGALETIQHPADAETEKACGPSGAGTSLDYALPALEGAELQTVYRARAAVAGSQTVTLRAALPYENASLDPPATLRTISQGLQVTIDGEPPTTRISEPPPPGEAEPGLPTALRGERFVLGGSAADADSWIERVDLSVRRANEARASWAFTTPSQTARWSAAWDLPEDGIYELAVTAVDAVGNESPELARSVLVDNSPPSVGLGGAEGGFLAIADVAPSGAVTATLRLTATDALAGIDILQISLDGRPFQRVPLQGEAPFPSAVDQDFAWRLPATAQGEHEVALRAYDRAGNLSAEQRATFVLDLSPPLSLLSTGRDAISASEPLILEGHTDETAALPLAPHPRELAGDLDAMADATVWEDLRGRIEEATPRWLGDVDGDGRADYAVGLPTHDEDGDGQPEGKIVIAFGKAGGWQVPPAAELLEADATLLLGAPGAGVGAHLAPGGDVDGDGLDDLLIGDPANNRVLIEFGAGGPRASGEVLDGESASRSVLLGPEDGSIGRHVSSAGDLNADGYADLVLVRSGAEGWAHVLLGGAGLRGRSLALADATALRLPMPAEGAPALAAGDLDGDGYADLALADPQGLRPGAGGQPSLRLVKGSSGFGAGPPMSVTIGGPAPLGDLIAAAGDVNGDGYADLAYADGDGARLALGASDLAGLELRSLDVPREQLVSLAGVGDLDPSASTGARPFDDLAIGTKDDGLRLLFGGAPFPADPVARATIAGVRTVAPSPFPGASDANCDGSADLLLQPDVDAGGTEIAEQPRRSTAAPARVKASPAGLLGRLVMLEDALHGALGEALATRDAPIQSGLPRDDEAAPSTNARPSAQALRVAWVSLAHCASCDNGGRVWGQEAFATIGAALASGADEVRVAAGVYEERVELGAGQALRGVGAEVTALRMPAGDASAAPLVTVAGEGAALSGLALLGRSADGQAQAAGILLQPGAVLEAERLLLRDTLRAAELSGASSELLLDRATVVANDEGIRARGCARLELRNSILAYHAGAALDLELAGCASPRETAYNGFWANGQDVLRDGLPVDPSEIGDGQVPADPRFVAPSAEDYRLRAGSPMVDAGQPGDPVPPGAGPRVDLGYAEQAAATAYAGADYCATCDNDGLRWQVDAFATIGEALEAARRARPASGCEAALAVGTGCGRPATVAVAPGVYAERLELPSDIRLLGSGADGTILDAGLAAGAAGSAVTLRDATRVELRGFTIRGFGTTPGSAGLRLVGATSSVTIAESLVEGRFAEASGAEAGIAVEGGASARILRSTLADLSSALRVDGQGSHAELSSSLLAEYQVGVELRNGARARSAYNLYHSTVSGAQPTAFVGAALVGDGSDLVDVDPLFVGDGATPYHVRAGSPVLGAGDPELPAPAASGGRVTIGYWDRLVAPVALHFGEPGARSCQDGHSGVAGVRVGYGRVDALSDTLQATRPTSWVDVTLEGESLDGAAGRFWSAALPPPGAEGLYRLYARSRDQAGNEAEQLLSELRADASPPLVALLSPASTVPAAGASLRVVASVTDVVLAAGLPEPVVEQAGFLLDAGEPGERYVPGTWLDEAWSVADGVPRVFYADLPLEAGGHSVRALARNEAGMEARSAAVSVTATGLDVASLVAPQDGATVGVRTIPVRGFARLADVGSREVRVWVDGQERATGTVAGEAAVGPFALELTLPEGDAHEIQVTVGGGDLAAAPIVAIVVDEQPPTLSLSAPAPASLESRSVSILGFAEDEGGEPPIVEVSLDGGAAWQTAGTEALQGGRRDFRLDWVLPGNSDGAAFPLRVRARDAAGNQALVSRTLRADNLPPQSPEILSISPREGSATPDLFASVTLRWVNPVRDGSGPARVEVATGMADAGRPPEGAWSDAMAGCSTQGTTWTCEQRAALSGSGAHMVFLRASDPAGNYNVTGYGPFTLGAAPLDAGADEARSLPGPSVGARGGARSAAGMSAQGAPHAGQARIAEPADAGLEARTPPRGPETGADLSGPDAAASQAPPSLRFHLPWSGTVAPGRAFISGRSADPDDGVVAVELRLAPDGPWRRARGTRSWSMAIDVPESGELRYEARAVDRGGLRSPVEAIDLRVDATPPLVELRPPIAPRGARVLLQGVAWDPQPARGPIAAVQVRVDGGRWRPATLGGTSPARGGRTWHLLWAPSSEAPSAHAVELRARDAAGNWSAPTAPRRLERAAAEESDLSAAIELAEPGPVAGRILRYTVRARNEGPAAAEDVVLTVGVPPETEVYELPATCMELRAALRCDLGVVPVGHEIALRFGLQVEERPRAERIRLHAAVAQPQARRDPNPWNHWAEALVETGAAGSETLYLPFTHRHGP